MNVHEAADKIIAIVTPYCEGGGPETCADLGNEVLTIIDGVCQEGHDAGYALCLKEMKQWIEKVEETA